MMIHTPAQAICSTIYARSGISGYVGRSAEQLFLGDYSSEVTLLGTAGQVASGFVGADLPGDIRDITHSLTHWEWSWGHAGKTGLNLAGILPVIGVIKYADEAGSLVKGAANSAIKLTGQQHHAISKTVFNALDRNPSLKGIYEARDPRFLTQAKDLASHRGYQQWHRALDKEVSGWIDAHPGLTPTQFEAYLKDVYSRADLLNRFPNGLGGGQ